jgi:aspartyl-tRNA(Asn)/glutamyl-tRNA(Gln) amidotransferase subunit A
MAAVLPLPELSAALRSGALSPVEHVREACDRLAGDRHGAVIVLDADRALAEARERAAELARGRWRGPLHGVAVGVKDLYDVAGLPTRCGSGVLADAPPAAADADLVARVREAGAVVVAKLHTHEFAYGPTGDVAATGPARNPHDPQRITGGSSSGSAASVAAGHLALALGTDTGASVRTPAALCGVVGLKPAFGALPLGGAFPLSETCDHAGFLTATSRARAGLGRAGARPARRRRRPGGAARRRLLAPADPALTAAVDAAADALRAAGVEVVEVRTPMIDELAATYATIVGAEAYATHAAWLAERPRTTSRSPASGWSRRPGSTRAPTSPRSAPAAASPRDAGRRRGGGRAAAADDPAARDADRGARGGRGRRAARAARPDPAVQPDGRPPSPCPARPTACRPGSSWPRCGSTSAACCAWRRS